MGPIFIPRDLNIQDRETHWTNLMGLSRRLDACDSFPVQIIPSNRERMPGLFSSAHELKPPLTRISVVSPDLPDLDFTGDVA